MNDIDLDSTLRDRFAELRSEERKRIPPFARVVAERRERLFRYRAASIVATILILLTVVTWGGVRHERRLAAERELAAAPFMASSVWHAPTDVLLRTPGRDLLSTVPRIVDEPAWLAEPHKAKSKGASS